MKDLLTFIVAILIAASLTACDGEETPTAEPDFQQPTVDNVTPVNTPVIIEDATAVPRLPLVTGTIPAEGGTSGVEDDLMGIDELLEEIDNSTCQNAYETQQELKALIDQGVDVAELETAVEELISELENCPTPTPGT